jgi:hypothetical protein
MRKLRPRGSMRAWGRKFAKSSGTACRAPDFRWNGRSPLRQEIAHSPLTPPLRSDANLNGKRAPESAMTRELLEACRRQGEPICYLWPTEDKICSRFGLGIASFMGEIDLPRERSAFNTPLGPLT